MKETMVKKFGVLIRVVDLCLVNAAAAAAIVGVRGFWNVAGSRRRGCFRRDSF